MKPADHPDFFRLPPPEGVSRESTIVLDAEGRFWHEGRLVEHPPMARAFASWIARHPDDGRYILNNGFDWCYFQVEDAPFFVERLRNDGGVPWVGLSDGSWEPLHAEGLEVGPCEALYVPVKGRFRARFRQSAQLALEPWLHQEGEGEVAVRVGTRLYPVRGSCPRK